MQKYVNTYHIKIFVWLSFSHGAHQSHMTRFCTCCLIKFTRQTHSPLLVIYKSVFITQVLWFTRQLTAGWRWRMPELSSRKKAAETYNSMVVSWWQTKPKQNKTTTKNTGLFEMFKFVTNALCYSKNFRDYYLHSTRCFQEKPQSKLRRAVQQYSLINLRKSLHLAYNQRDPGLCRK